MNMPLEAPSNQSDLVRQPSDAIADAAQFKSAPQAEAGAPPIAADVVPAVAPDASVAAGGKPSHDDDPHGKAALGDEIGAEDPCECEKRTAVALDEVSKANLRRLETTLSQLHNEFDACPVPRAAPLPPVSALPVIEPIDRISLGRRQQPPTRPIWLQEQQTQVQPPPPPERGVFWPRATKFLIACGIAAPLSYYLAVATSPLHKPLVEVTELAPVVPEPPASAPQARDGILASMAGPESAPAQQRALTPEQFVKTPAFPRSPPAETAIRSSPEMPLAEPASVPATKTANLQDVDLLIDRGRKSFEAGDLIGARILFLRAVIAGDAGAAVAMGATYDPVVLADRGVRGGVADLDKARSWYERAKEMGSPEGPRRLEMLANR